MTELSKDKTGVCVWFCAKKGIGFIARDNGEKDLFVYWANIVAEGFKTLRAGQHVSFDIGENNKGPQAVNVVVIEDVKRTK